MYGIREALFGSAGRRFAALLVANALFFGGGRAIQVYILDVASSPGLSFVLILLWMTLACVAALFTVIGLGDFIFHRRWSEGFLRDEMAELDARIDGREAPQEESDDYEELAGLKDNKALHLGLDLAASAAVSTLMEEDAMVLAVSGRDSTFRFGLYFLAIAAMQIFTSNSLADGFLERYSHPGVAVIHMRNDDPVIRRRGLTMLIERLDFTVTSAVSDVVVLALDDTDEGVAARAAFIAGTLEVTAASPRLSQMVREQPALSFTAMIALGQVGGPDAKTVAEALLNHPNAKAEPRALALMIGLLKIQAPDTLKAIHAAAADTNTRLAAVWAIGEVPDRRQLDFLAKALEDEALSIRCAAATAFEHLVELKAYEPLRDAFMRSKDPLEMCPAATIPVQEGGRKKLIVKHRNYQLGLVRALSTTDDPRLLKWLVANQADREWVTYKFMEAKWKQLKEKDERGELNMLKRRIQDEKLREAAKAAPDAARPGPDAEVRPAPDR